MSNGRKLWKKFNREKFKIDIYFVLPEMYGKLRWFLIKKK